MNAARLLYAVSSIIFTSCSGALAQAVHDEFTETEPRPENWFVCVRDENEFAIEDVTDKGFRALRTTVHPRPELEMFGVQVHKECHLNDSLNDQYERAEVWEADSIVQALSTEVWYRFSMYVDPSITWQAKRFVAGQWKQSMTDRDGDFSPVLAQRFTGRKFTLTIEQDNDQPDHDPRDISCRIIIATDRAALASNENVAGSTDFEALAAETPRLLSIGHDNFDVTHQVVSGTELEAPTAQDTGCARDLVIKHLNDLPDVFGQWITMKFHLRFSTTKGLIEVWADDVPIVTVEGRIGYRTSDAHAKQYFKFGPYRNHEESSNFTLLARYARAFSEADLK